MEAPEGFEEENQARYDAAVAEAAAVGGTVCATYVDHVPMYFVMPSGASEPDIRARAFELRNGRKMTTMEAELASLVDRNPDFDWSQENV